VWVNDALRSWAATNSPKLVGRGVTIDARIPTRSDNAQFKSSIGFESATVMVTYTVWDRDSFFLVELIVFSKTLRQTLFFRDATQPSIQAIISELDKLRQDLLDRAYDNMEPDPNLIIR
jgi:hypothetical protein